MSKVIVITEKEAQSLMGQEWTTDVLFNPIQDEKGNWVISVEEVRSEKQEFAFIKEKTEIEFEVVLIEP